MFTVLNQYGIAVDACVIKPLGNGLINKTWLIEYSDQRFVLQKINQQVFKSPADIAFNISSMTAYLQQNHPGYLFTSAIKNKNGQELTRITDGYFRLFNFIEGSHTLNVVETPQQAFEAAKQFGRFSSLLSGMDTSQLKITLPRFHDLGLRYEQFEYALLNGNKERIRRSREYIQFIREEKHILDAFESYRPGFKTRPMHHDTKISNVLFDKDGKGFCVIDLDTVMPGYFISDVGDMMRTYLSPVNEEEADYSKILIRKDIYEAVINGYHAEMGDELTEFEKTLFHYAGLFMIYMQAMRFLTDHLNDDVYYGAKYTNHNYIRAGNQLTLLKRFIEISSC